MQLAANDAAAVHAVPLPANPWCLFLDVDGTLLELASTPHAVIVVPTLLELMTRLRSAAGGALALVSGRTIANLDGLFGTDFPAAGLPNCASPANGLMMSSARSVRPNASLSTRWGLRKPVPIASSIASRSPGGVPPRR